MKIAVCIKFIQGEINPFDACALECALECTLRWRETEVVVVSMGPEKIRPSLEALTRLGSFRTILISDPLYAGSDTIATSYILACVLKKLKPDLIFCGRQSIDGDTAQTGPCLARRLNIPLLANIMALPMENQTDQICQSRIGPIELSVPALLTIERINTLRFPALHSKIRSIEVWDNAIVEADPGRCGLAGSPTRVIKTFETEHGRRKCRFIARTDLDRLIQELRSTDPSEEETNLDCMESGPHLKSVAIVGEELYDQATRIADHLEILHRDTPEVIADWVRYHRPEVVLWPADSWGRNNAPQAAILLETGLCADCIQLAVEEGRLIMYRPAQGARIIAKIECRTLPQMATVRTISTGSEIIFSCGRGVAHDLERARHYANKIGAELGSSRVLVELGLLPYEYQVGLTGRAVSPKIYIAAGISGAIGHTAGIENAKYVIAVNPDRNARIFDYADYGIIDKF